MPPDRASLRTRRSLITAAVAALAGFAANAIGRPQRTQAADGDPLIAGQTVTSSSMTRIQSTANVVPAFAVETLTGYAVSGSSVTSAGVSGYSTDSVGVLGVSDSAKAGIAGGSSSSQTGIIGFSGPGSIAAYPAETGVHGYSAVSAASQGVFGQSTSGVGVRGEATIGTGMEAVSDSGSGLKAVTSSAVGVVASSGLEFGEVPDPVTPSTGVYGISLDGTGVYGASNTGVAVYGATHGAVAIVGQGNDATGVMGYSDAGSAPVAPPKVGVYGHATQDGSARGVFGRTNAGTGVHGFAGSGSPPASATKTGIYGRSDIDSVARGVSGHSSPGTGVYGSTSGGTALQGIATSTVGFGLKATGRVELAKASGVATIPAGASAITVSPGMEIASGTFVFVGPQADPGTRRLWATMDASANTITIHASSSVAAPLRVAWLALG